MPMNPKLLRPRLAASGVVDPPGCTQSSIYLALTGANDGTTFADSSVNNLTVTRVGSVVTSTAQSPNGVGSSAYFPGSGGSYLQLPSSAALDLGTASFTVEFWFRTPTYPGVGEVLTARWGSPANGIWIGLGGDGLLELYSNNSLRIKGGRWTANTWHHLAIVRDSTWMYLYLDGKRVAAGWNLGAGGILAGPAWRIGWDNGVNQLFTGYISDYRIVKGFAVYTGPFTPPSSPVGRCALAYTADAVVSGCTDSTAVNYNAAANVNDGSCNFTPATVPAAITDLTATAGDELVTLSWTAPDDGGAAITDYLIEVSDDSGSTWSAYTDATETATVVSVTGRTNGTQYYFRVAAVNSVGIGDWSNTPDATPAAVAPGTPTSLYGTAYSGYIQIGWTEPDAGSRPPLSYEIEYSTDGGASAAGSFTSAEAYTSITPTTDGTTYHFRVRAAGHAGTLFGEWSEWSGGYVYLTVPGEPQSPSATAGDGYVTVSWAAPAFDGGSAITGYAIERSDGGYGFFAPASTVYDTTFTDLSVSNGTEYYYRVYAINEIGNGPSVDTDGGTGVTPHRLGCMDSMAMNYDPAATQDDGSCTYPVYGCTDSMANNYDPSANTDDGSCTYPTYGCTDPGATNYDSTADTDDGSCTY